jgi:hypothetical protein
MIATNIHIIRESVILLLRRNGYSVIEAVDKWDRVYSLQYNQATPNVPHIWRFGEYELEFIKTGNTEPIEQVQTQASPKLLAWVVAFALLTLFTCALLVIR